MALAWTVTDARHSLNLLFDVYGARPQKLTFRGESSLHAPGLATQGFVSGVETQPSIFDLILAWTGTDANRSLNLLRFEATADLAGLKPGVKRALPARYSSAADPTVGEDDAIINGGAGDPRRRRWMPAPTGAGDRPQMLARCRRPAAGLPYRALGACAGGCVVVLDVDTDGPMSTSDCARVLGPATPRRAAMPCSSSPPTRWRSRRTCARLPASGRSRSSPNPSTSTSCWPPPSARPNKRWQGHRITGERHPVPAPAVRVVRACARTDCYQACWTVALDRRSLRRRTSMRGDSGRSS